MRHLKDLPVLILGLGYVFLSACGLTGLGYAWILSYLIMAIVLMAILFREGKIISAGNR